MQRKRSTDLPIEKGACDGQATTVPNFKWHVQEIFCMLYIHVSILKDQPQAVLSPYAVKLWPWQSSGFGDSMRLQNILNLEVKKKKALKTWTMYKRKQTGWCQLPLLKLEINLTTGNLSHEILQNR